jgi:hypothetical protein
MNRSPPSLPFLGLVSQVTAKPEFLLAIGGNASSSVLCSSDKLMIENNEAHL